MTAVYIACFIAGLLIGVAIMLFGIERKPSIDASSSGDGLRSWLPLFASFAVAFGVAGYSLSRVVSAGASLAWALVVGAAAAFLMRWIVAKSAAMPVEHDVDDPRYVLQGHVAQVTSSIKAGAEGRISFDYGNERRTLRARSLDDVAVDEGTEVVIERIEGDLAYVEPWLQVEQRL